MKYTEIQKIQIAPQIVVYKNIFKFNQEMIDLLDKNNPDSILDPWRDWYEQGERRGILFNKFNTVSESDNQVAKKEKEYIESLTA